MERVAAQHGLCCPNWTFDTETAETAKSVMDSAAGGNLIAQTTSSQSKIAESDVAICYPPIEVG